MLAVNAAFPSPEHSSWSQCERLLPQALRAAQIIEQYQIISEEAGRLLHETATYLKDRARYSRLSPDVFLYFTTSLLRAKKMKHIL